MHFNIEKASSTLSLSCEAFDERNLEWLKPDAASQIAPFLPHSAGECAAFAPIGRAGLMLELHRECEAGVATLTLDVPGKKNALTEGLRTELRDALLREEADPEVRAIVLTGRGGAFCSGGDISLMGKGDEADRRARLAILHDVVRVMITGGKPVVAAVSGIAYGGGFSLAMAADYVVADTTARFCASFAKVGLTGDMGILWTLPRRIGMARTRQFVLDGRVVTAREAATAGIVDEVVAPDGLLCAACATALAASASAPLAIARTKALTAEDGSLETLLAAEMEAQMHLFASTDHVEARNAFLERRPPGFIGR